MYGVESLFFPLPFGCLVACDFRHCISLSLIHQVRSEITRFFDRTFHRILLCLNHYIF
nr:MAG TPA: hypothetical protein [Caudoviricetes sp.]